MSLRNKLLILSLGLALIPLISAVVIMRYIAGEQAGEALAADARNQLIALREAKKSQIEDYLRSIEAQVRTLSRDRMVVDAMREFAAGFRTVAVETDKPLSQATLKKRLAHDYQNHFLARYRESNPGAGLDIEAILARLDHSGMALQNQYIVENPNPIGSKHLLDAAPDGTEYSFFHKKYHPVLRDYLEKFGYYDIFLVEPDQGNIVYTVFKEVDFGTSLLTGPYANTGIAQVFKQVRHAKSADTIAFADFAPYAPSCEAPAAFIASPIFDGQDLIGVLIFQMPIDRINAVMTNHQRWREVGLGASGETYLVGSDFKSRSVSRFLVEDKAGYLQALEAVDVDPAVIREIDSRGTNIGIQTIRTPSVEAALAGKAGFMVTPDYRGVRVLSAYTPIETESIKWALLSEVDEAETLAPRWAMERHLTWGAVILIAVMILVAGGIAVVFSRRLMRPVLNLDATIEQVAANNDLTLRATVESKDEIGKMAQGFNRMMDRFEALIQQIISTAGQLASASEEVATVSQESARSIDRQRLETEQVATAMNEMSATVEEVASNTSNAAEAAGHAEQKAKTGKSVVEAATRSIENLTGAVNESAEVIRHLHEESEKIGTVVDVIKSIAEQTNLLALNAAIEAARAGEQGRGFAVVADEVRTLAQRTQTSTQEIEEMIGRLQAGANQAVQAMENGQSQATQGQQQAGEAMRALEGIVEAVATINQMNLQIASAAEEQSATAEEMNRNVINIRDVADQTASGAEQTTAAAEELANLANRLQSLVEQFRIHQAA